MIKLLEHELLLELEQLCRHIDCCIEQSNYRDVVYLDKQCQTIISRIAHLAKVSRSQALGSQVASLKQRYRRLLEQSIFIAEPCMQRLTA